MTPTSPPSPTFDRVYADHFSLVWRVVRRRGVPEDHIDDVVQDVFLVLHRRLGEYDGVTPVRAWVLGIAARVVADHRRRARRKDAPLVPHLTDSNHDIALPSPMPGPGENAEQRQALALVDELLSGLTHDKREAFVLAELEELTVPEIAALVNANVNTVYARLRAARQEFEQAYARRAKRAERRGKEPR